MKMKRYRWPVIIAAGLHGALFLGLPATPAKPTLRVECVPLVCGDPPPRDWVPEPTEAGSGSEASSEAKPLPCMPDMPPVPRDDGLFEVPIDLRVTRADSIQQLPEPTVGTIPGPGPDRFGPGPLPDGRKLDRMPRAVVRPVPRYPEVMRREGVDGRVTVQFVVDATGRVVSAEAVDWTHREFVAPAVEAVRQWRFQPGTMQGRPVSFRMAVPIVFATGG